MRRSRNFLRLPGSRPLIWVAAGGPASLQLTVVKILQKKGTETNNDRHDSGGVPQIRDPSESDRSGKMGSTAQDLLVLEFLVLGQ